MALPGDEARKYVPTADDKQVQPAGVDLRVSSIERIIGAGFLGEDKVIPRGETIEISNNSWRLSKGAYRIRFQDIVRVPPDAIGLCFPRSSLLRMGATISCAVWDPGYEGRGQALLIVFNEDGIELKANARVAQIVFISLREAARQLYRGSYHREGME